jgi:hypothetical protein
MQQLRRYREVDRCLGVVGTVRTREVAVGLQHVAVQRDVEGAADARNEQAPRLGRCLRHAKGQREARLARPALVHAVPVVGQRHGGFLRAAIDDAHHAAAAQGEHRLARPFRCGDADPQRHERQKDESQRRLHRYADQPGWRSNPSRVASNTASFFECTASFP